MKTLSMPFNMVIGPSDEMVTALYDSIVTAIDNNKEIFEYSIDDGLIRVHEEVELSIQVFSLIYPDVMRIDYILSFNGYSCDFVPCNAYAELVSIRMKELFFI